VKENFGYFCPCYEGDKNVIPSKEGFLIEKCWCDNDIYNKKKGTYREYQEDSLHIKSLFLQDFEEVKEVKFIGLEREPVSVCGSIQGILTTESDYYLLGFIYCCEGVSLSIRWEKIEEGTEYLWRYGNDIKILEFSTNEKDLVQESYRVDTSENKLKYGDPKDFEAKKIKTIKEIVTENRKN
jgi:hypothetical protein